MRIKRIYVTLLIFLLTGLTVGEASTLREMYELAGPQGGYDKWIELETGVVYTGGLLIGPIFYPYSDTPVGESGQDVRIVGNGAILDLQGEQILISFCNNRLDIEDCVIINGGVRYRGYESIAGQLHPAGSVHQVTFWRPHDYGVRVRVDYASISIERNLFVDAVDTGSDYVYFSSIPSEWLPTGTSVSSTPGSSDIRENWTYHTDPVINANPLAHFSFLCPYG